MWSEQGIILNVTVSHRLIQKVLKKYSYIYIYFTSDSKYIFKHLHVICNENMIVFFSQQLNYENASHLETTVYQLSKRMGRR